MSGEFAAVEGRATAVSYTDRVKGTFLTQQINFIIAVCCLGSVVLLSSTAIMNAAEMDNPVVDAMVATGLADL